MSLFVGFGVTLEIVYLGVLDFVLEPILGWAAGAGDGSVSVALEAWESVGLVVAGSGSAALLGDSADLSGIGLWLDLACFGLGLTWLLVRLCTALFSEGLVVPVPDGSRVITGSVMLAS